MLGLLRLTCGNQMPGGQVCRLAKFERKFGSDSDRHVVVMVRHGQSVWNQKNLFCGWYNAELSPKGKQEAREAGKAIREAQLKFDVAHTSLLKRAQQTLACILAESGQKLSDVKGTWRLNERHYGALTGLNKAETAKKYGEEQVKIWRRSFDTPPPAMESSHEFYDCITKDPIYVKGPRTKEFPTGESLKMTIERTLPYWKCVIEPQIKAGKRLIISAHGNSLRGIVKHLDRISDKDIMELNLPTGIPFLYELDSDLCPVVSLRFLGDPETVQKATEAVSKQGKAN